MSAPRMEIAEITSDFDALEEIAEQFHGCFQERTTHAVISQNETFLRGRMHANERPHWKRSLSAHKINARKAQKRNNGDAQ